MRYTGITIGPIIKTVLRAKSTKAIWTSSYIFSYIMKSIIEKADINYNHLVLPYVDKEVLPSNFEVGLFPDNIIYKGEINGLEAIIDKVIVDFSGKLYLDIKNKNSNINSKSVLKFLQEYLNIYSVIVDVKKGVNVIVEVKKALDSIELKNIVLSNASEDYLYHFFEETFYNFLIRAEFKKQNRRFPSTVEIANGQFKNKDSERFKAASQILFGKDEVDSQQLFLQAIKEDSVFGKEVLNYQKYIAVIQADGDKIGAFINSLYESNDPDTLTKAFSKNLLHFGREAIIAIKDYGGVPVYAGGDDLMFLAPVAISTTKGDSVYAYKSIFDLIQKIDDIFDKYFINYKNDNVNFQALISRAEEKPSMSYGIAISYYKHPLNEALQVSYDALEKAKEGGRNSIAFKVTKHSLQAFDTIFNKAQNSMDTFYNLIGLPLLDVLFINSVAHKLNPLYSSLYAVALINNLTQRNFQIEAIFINNFNEAVHLENVNGKKELIPFLKIVMLLLQQVFAENDISQLTIDQETQFEINMKKIYASLRFIEFINNKVER